MPAGRPPKPTRMKMLQGNPGKRALNQGEPKPKLKRPKCPAHLQGEARKEWNRISKLLVELGILAEVDRAALAMYCTQWGRYVEAETKLADSSRWVEETDNGYKYQTVWLQISATAMKQMTRMLAEFGLSPSTRSRIKVEGQKEESPLVEFLKRRSA